MSSASNRRKDSGGEDEGGGANWMDTYGDLVTLLLTFFVLLFAMSEIDAEKFRQLAGSFSGSSVVDFSPMSPQMAIESPVSDPTEGLSAVAAREDTTAEEDDAEDPAQLENNVMELYNHMLGFIERESIAAEVVLIDEDYMVRLIMHEMVFFRTGEAVLLSEAFPILDKVIQMFHEAEHMYTMLSIEGHTDNRPINTAQFPSNWELSSHRALSVGSYIRSSGLLEEHRLQVLGFGEWHPVAPNNSPENMSLNRRVEFVAETRMTASRGRPPLSIEMNELLIETGD